MTKCTNVAHLIIFFFCTVPEKVSSGTVNVLALTIIVIKSYVLPSIPIAPVSVWSWGTRPQFPTTQNYSQFPLSIDGVGRCSYIRDGLLGTCITFRSVQYQDCETLDSSRPSVRHTLYTALIYLTERYCAASCPWKTLNIHGGLILGNMW